MIGTVQFKRHSFIAGIRVSEAKVLRVLSESYYRLDLAGSCGVLPRILILRRRLDSLENGERHIPIGPGPGLGPEIPCLAINARRARVWPMASAHIVLGLGLVQEHVVDRRGSRAQREG